MNKIYTILILILVFLSLDAYYTYFFISDVLYVTFIADLYYYFEIGCIIIMTTIFIFVLLYLILYYLSDWVIILKVKKYIEIFLVSVMLFAILSLIYFFCEMIYPEINPKAGIKYFEMDPELLKRLFKLVYPTIDPNDLCIDSIYHISIKRNYINYTIIGLFYFITILLYMYGILRFLCISKPCKKISNFILSCIIGILFTFMNILCCFDNSLFTFVMFMLDVWNEKEEKNGN